MKTKTKATKVNANLINYLELVAPVGKNPGKVAAVLPPFPDNATLLSDDDTKPLESVLVHWTELNQIEPVANQRDAEKRKIKNYKYLSSSAYNKKTGRIMHAVRLPDGTLRLIDGNTRVVNYHEERYRRAAGGAPTIDLPEYIILIIHTVSTEAEAKHLYYTFDSQGAVENAAEKMNGGADALGLTFKSDLVSSGSYKMGLSIYSKYIPGVVIDSSISEEIGLVDHFKEQLLYIDSNVRFTSKELKNESVAYMANMMLKNRTSKVECRSIMEFFNNVANREGMVVTPNNKTNAVGHLVNEYFGKTSDKRFNAKSQYRVAVFGLWIYYYTQWIDNPLLPIPKTRMQRDELTALVREYLG